MGTTEENKASEASFLSCKSTQRKEARRSARAIGSGPSLPMISPKARCRFPKQNPSSPLLVTSSRASESVPLAMLRLSGGRRRAASRCRLMQERWSLIGQPALTPTSSGGESDTRTEGFCGCKRRLRENATPFVEAIYFGRSPWDIGFRYVANCYQRRLGHDSHRDCEGGQGDIA